jgi:predicted cobalt transporter CbtA
LIQYDWLATGLACLIALGLIIFDRQLWFARLSPEEPEVVSEPVTGV